MSSGSLFPKEQTPATKPWEVVLWDQAQSGPEDCGGRGPSPAPLLACPVGTQFRCTPPVPADMVFLVDGSWSIGHSHFQLVKDFLASVISPFEIGPGQVQVGGYRTQQLLRRRAGKYGSLLGLITQPDGKIPADPTHVVCMGLQLSLPQPGLLAWCAGIGAPLGSEGPGCCRQLCAVWPWAVSSKARPWKLSPAPGPPPGLTQYSGDPQTEWDLNSFHTRAEVLAAVRSLQYKGGNTFTGSCPPCPQGSGCAEAPLLPAAQPS